MGIPGTGPGSVIVPHASEIDYVYADTLSLKGEEGELALAMSTRWSTFAKTGKPDAGAWPTYSDEDVVQSFQTASEGGIRTTQYIRKKACDYWDHFKMASSGQQRANIFAEPT